MRNCKQDDFVTMSNSYSNGLIPSSSWICMRQRHCYRDRRETRVSVSTNGGSIYQFLQLLFLLLITSSTTTSAFFLSHNSFPGNHIQRWNGRDFRHDNYEGSVGNQHERPHYDYLLLSRKRLHNQQHLKTKLCLEASARRESFIRFAAPRKATTRSFLLPVEPLSQQNKEGSWFPIKLADDDIFGFATDEQVIQQRAVQLAADLIRERLKQEKTNEDDQISSTSSTDISKLVKGRFIDLTCNKQGENILENLFLSPMVESIIRQFSDNEIRGAVQVIQSLCVMGTQVGMKGPPEQLKRMVSHLDDRANDPQFIQRDMYECWDHDSVRRLKYRLNREPALDLLALLKRKRMTQGAFDLLAEMGVWTKHEDLALLRSGFPLRFSNEEEQAARNALLNVENYKEDPDTILGLRQDLRHLKVYTIDGVSASEIDDGLSVEKIEHTVDDGSTQQRYRIWIHIADADRWAPRNSTLLETARRRITSLYLPTGPIPMFPKCVSTDLMSLIPNQDVCSLSLGVELNEDGSVDTSTIVVTPSIIRVDYRLSYDDVDEMLDEGIGYNEEWQLGALLVAAKKRRQYRIRNGSSEGVVPNPIPYSSIELRRDETAPDGFDVNINVQVSHNSAKNKTALAEEGFNAQDLSELTVPEQLSSAYLLVTEAMILAGEAVGCWKCRLDEEETLLGSSAVHENQLRLPFRTQAPPDYNSRARERKVLMSLLEYNIGNGLCHAWYIRRFLQAVKVQEEQMFHSGLGLKSYVQWSSPIRRFSDLQVHASVKRYLRRRRVYELMQNDTSITIPRGIRAIDLGISLDAFDVRNETLTITRKISLDDLDQDLNFQDGIGLVGAAKNVQRRSQQYWMFEYIRRIRESDPDRVYKGCILGCIDPERQQYAIYIYELGLEHRYISPVGRLEPGTTLQIKVDNVNPRAGLLNFVRVV